MVDLRNNPVNCSALSVWENVITDCSDPFTTTAVVTDTTVTATAISTTTAVITDTTVTATAISTTPAATTDISTPSGVIKENRTQWLEIIILPLAVLYVLLTLPFMLIKCWRCLRRRYGYVDMANRSVSR